MSYVAGDLPPPDAAARHAVRTRAARVLRPAGAFSRLDQLAVWLAGWQATPHPAVDRPAALLFAADHGVAARGVSAYPAEVTGAMVAALEKGVATASVLSAQVGASLEVVDVGVGEPTHDLSTGPALDLPRFAQAWAAGQEAVERTDGDLLVLGEMGIGNTTAAAAVATGLFGGPTAGWVGPGTGVGDDALAHKSQVVEEAVDRLPADVEPLEVLRHVGGAELVAVAAALWTARRRPVPVLLDGFVVTAAAAVLHRIRPDALDHCWAAHRSPEPGHGRLLAELGLEPLLELELRLGEGSGALAAVPLVRLAAAAVTEVATFEEWGLQG